MGEPIHLDNGRVVYGRAQAAVMDKLALIVHPFFEIVQREEVASEPGEQSTPLPAPADSVSFQVVSGIGPSIEMALYDAGILTWEDVLQAGVVKIDQRISGIGMSRARALFAMAQQDAD